MPRSVTILLALLFPLSFLSAQYHQINYQLEKQYELQDHIQLDGNAVNMIPFKQDGLYGFVKKGHPEEWVIEPQFKKVFAVYAEGAIVSPVDTSEYYEEGDDRFGFINAEGELVIPPYFDHIRKVGNLLHGLIFYISDTTREESSLILNVFFDNNGKELFIESAHDQKTFNEVDTLAYFRKGPQITIRGASGKIWKQFRIDQQQEADAEFLGIENNVLLYRTEVNDNYVYKGIDVHGKEKFEVPFGGQVERIVQLNKYLYMYEEDYYYGFFNEKGQYKTYEYRPKTFKGKDYYHAFYLDYYNIRNENTGKMGLLSRSGKQLIDFEYEYIDEVVNGTVFCLPPRTEDRRSNNRRGQIRSIKDKLLVDNIATSFEFVERFQEMGKPIAFYDGLLNNISYVLMTDTTANGEINEYFGDQVYFYYYDENKKSKFRLPPNLVYAGLFNEGLAPVVNQSWQLGFIDSSGRQVIDFQYEFPRDPYYPAPRYITPAFIGGYAYVKPQNAYIDRQGRPYYSYTSKYKIPAGTSGEWMQVRKERVGQEIGYDVEQLSLKLTDTGLITASHYGSPNASVKEGVYEIRDSVLVLNPTDDDCSTFRYYLDRCVFYMEQYDEEMMVLREHRYPNSIARDRYYFIPKEKFQQYTSEQIKMKYGFTQSDSLKVAAAKKAEEELKELRKNDQSSPSFPGGYDAQTIYIKDNLIYPPDHDRIRLIKITFDVETDGTITNIQDRGSGDDAYYEEAIRLIKSMPKWLPARFDGVATKMTTNLRVVFEKRE